MPTLYSLASFGLALAQETADAPQGTRSPFTSFLPMILIFFAIMYFLMIRPQQKRERERRQMLSALAKGDEVVTTGGMCGTIVGISEKTVVLRVSEEPAVKMEFVRAAIAQVTRRESAGD